MGAVTLGSRMVTDAGGETQHFGVLRARQELHADNRRFSLTRLNVSVFMAAAPTSADRC